MQHDSLFEEANFYLYNRYTNCPMQTAANEGPSPSVPSFENLLNNQPGGQVTAPPGFPWRDPLDQIFGITTSSPVITASVASNMLVRIRQALLFF